MTITERVGLAIARAAVRLTMGRDAAAIVRDMPLIRERRLLWLAEPADQSPSQLLKEEQWAIFRPSFGSD
jgi:hypothetical protein